MHATLLTMAPSRTILLIPYYNSAERLLASLASVDSAENCDVLIVDDGSTERPLDLESARTAFTANGTVYGLVLPENRGIENALNAGLDWIAERDYTYIARLDCGDLNRPGRLALQESFLDDHPDVLLVGGAAAFVDLEGNQQFVYRLPTSHEAIAAKMRNNSAFMHPSVMFRTSALSTVGHYPLDTPAAEDYEFFWRFIDAGRVANLPHVLIDYELDPGGISLSKRTTQLTSRLQIQRAHDDGSWAARLGRARTRALLKVPYSTVFALKRLTRASTRPSATPEPPSAAPSHRPLTRLTVEAVDAYCDRLQNHARVSTSAGGERPRRIALVLQGSSMSSLERLAADFCSRGDTVTLVPVTRAAVEAADTGSGLDAILSFGATPVYLAGVPTLVVTDDEGIALEQSATLADTVRWNRPRFEVRLADTMGAVLATGEVASRRTVAATLERAQRIVGPLLVIGARELPLPATPPAAALHRDARRPGNASADALGGVWFAGRIAERVASVRQWQLGRIPGRKPIRLLLASDGTPPRPVRWHSAPTPDFWADPHVLATEGGDFLLVEELDMETGRGAIRLLEIEGDDIAPLGIVLRTDHHLSYPQVYRVGDRWLATVETCARHNPIYTFDRVGDPWRVADDLPPLPPHLADPVLLIAPPDDDPTGTPQVNGLIGTDARVDPDAVVVQYTLDRDRTWRRLDRATRVDVRNGRGGGTLDLARGLRATQDCSGEYGRAVELLGFPETQPPDVIIRVDTATVGPDDGGHHQRGLHTLSWSDSGTTVWADGWHRRLTPLGWLWDQRERRHLDHCTG